MITSPMTTIPFFPAEPNQDQHHQFFSQSSQASSSSSLSCHMFFSSSAQDQAGCYHQGDQKQPEFQQEADNFASGGGPCDIENEINGGLKFSIWKNEKKSEDQGENSQVKWMSSKMRVMLKMKNSDRAGVPQAQATSTTRVKLEEDQKQPSSPLEADNCSNTSSNNSNNPIRVCSDCNTTKTPLWRSGPRGPKSLCNACGIRQRKARRAMAAAANGTILPAVASPLKAKVHKDKKSNIGHVKKYKKRCKLASTPSRGREKLCFEDFLISLSKNLAFHRVFPQDEKEAAILLMALSCGHVHG
ncbi:hypothetical protein RJ639_017388 [Escallonia herrerae]|uniref:GATA-type domain-containing protein n=1 Tax=Escallonia herrerae TaxID=1293975 RepID=A0AA88VAF4_9ASTE|nr:hypothetical protein RJ639_017388 [Escallonia herrerae]